jgi:hypothetical protein
VENQIRSAVSDTRIAIRLAKLLSVTRVGGGEAVYNLWIDLWMVQRGH